MAFSLEDCRVASTDENVRDSKLTLLQKDFYLICREMPLIRGVQPTKELLNALFMGKFLCEERSQGRSYWGRVSAPCALGKIVLKHSAWLSSCLSYAWSRTRAETHQFFIFVNSVCSFPTIK